MKISGFKYLKDTRLIICKHMEEIKMTEVKVRIGTIDAAKEFISKTTKQIFDIDIVSGRYIIDAKSIMGIFSLDLTKILTLKIHAEKAECEDFLNLIDNIIVK